MTSLTPNPHGNIFSGIYIYKGDYIPTVTPSGAGR